MTKFDGGTGDALGLLTPDDIAGVEDIQYEIVEVPEWGGRVRVRSLFAEERDRFEESLTVGKGKARKQSLHNFRAKLVALSLVDAQGERLYNDDAKHVIALGKRNAAALARIATVCSRLSGLTADEIEEMVDDLGNAPGADSSSS